jgi:hypothetical protein
MKLDDNNIPGQPVPSRPAVMETTPATVCQPAPSKQAVKQWNDRLGKRVIKNIHRFHQCEQDWARYAKSSRTRNHLHEDVGTIQHPAAKFLEHLRTNGVPIRMMDENWTSEMLAERAQRGSHQSTKAYVDFVREEMADFDEKSFWTILPLATIQHIPNLRLSPLGCVPQRDRRPRLINDLSFYEINKNTVCMAPPDAMQFGRALERVLHKIKHADPRHGPVYLCKIDIADGFYRVDLEASSAPTLAVILPHNNGEQPLVAIPLSLPMGWVESPPYFCAVTETIADIANRNMHHRAPPHRLDELADTPPPTDGGPLPAEPSLPTVTEPLVTQPLAPPRPRLAYIDVYVDDFLGACQGNKRERTRVRRILLHSIDRILAPLDSVLHPQHNKPTSVKKLRKGDAYWATSKVMLGWLVDTVADTISLPPHRVQRLHEIFESLQGKKRTSLKIWHRVIGELRSMVLAIPGCRGLFSPLQHSLTHSDKHRIRITPDVRDALDDFETLGQSIASRPTRLGEIVPATPLCTGAHDASGRGAGGIWFAPSRNLVWRQPFPPAITTQLVSSSNPTGILTNSDFEQAGGVWHHMLLANEVDIRERTVHSFGDNTPAVSRFKKGATTTKGAPAYLNRLFALHQRAHRYLSQHDYIPGPTNAMADDASRLWDLSDNALLAHFNQRYPQEYPWEIAHLPSHLILPVISSLQGKRLSVPLQLDQLQPFPPALELDRLQMVPPALPFSLPLLPATEKDPCPTAASPSDLVRWMTYSATSVRRWPAWGSPTLAGFSPTNSR